jgi:NADH/NAD ratio-sensing transcriptional regulator Rex
MMIKQEYLHCNKGVPTTVTFPLNLYYQIVEDARKEGISMAELVRRAVVKEYGIRKDKSR